MKDHTTDPVGKEEELQLRKLLNDFFQDVDTPVLYTDQLANAIVDVHFKKFESFISKVRESAVREERSKILEKAQYFRNKFTSIERDQEYKEFLDSLSPDQKEKI